MKSIVASLISSVILFLSSAFLSFQKWAVLYLVLGSIVSLLMLWEAPKFWVRGQAFAFGVAYEQGHFKITNRKKFFVTWIGFSFIGIPLELLVVLGG